MRVSFLPILFPMLLPFASPFFAQLAWSSQGDVSSAELIAEVQRKNGKFTEYHLPADVNPQAYGCHSIQLDSKGRIWATMPWANLILSFDPGTKTFSRYPLPTPESKPDGIAIDGKGRVWFGVDSKGGLGVIDPATGAISEFPAPEGRTFNIIAVGGDGKIWATSHQSRTVNLFNSVDGRFSSWRVRPEWPLDVRADEDGTAWAAGMNAYSEEEDNGALIHLNENEGPLEYFPLPTLGSTHPYAYWLTPTPKSVVVTSSSDGIFLFDKLEKSYIHVVRSDGKQFFNIVRASKKGTIAIANASSGMKSLDLFDPENPGTIQSYALPSQEGEIREALAFDADGGIWYCQTGDVLGHLTPAP